MNTSPSTPIKPFDRRLLARMTGGLGDDKTVGKICADLSLVFTEFLPDVFQSETGLDITFAYAGFDTGTYDDLVTGLGTGVALADYTLRNWAQKFTIGCDSPVVITMMEALLGAPANTIEEPKPRRLSTIEMDLAAMVFEKIAGVLRSAVNAPGGFEPTGGFPYNSADRPKPEADAKDVFAASVNMTIGLGPVLSTFSIIIPQQTLLKTNVVFPKGVGQAKKASTRWTESLEEQVRKSSVTLEARIKLESLSLDTISRLQPGDVIPFLDRQDVRVDVNGNGRNLYVCEFGRSGSKYTVRVKDTYGSDDDILNHLMS